MPQFQTTMMQGDGVEVDDFLARRKMSINSVIYCVLWLFDLDCCRVVTVVFIVSIVHTVAYFSHWHWTC